MEKPDTVCAPVSFGLLYADLLRHGRSVCSGAVQRLKDHYGGGNRQPGDAYANGDYRGICHGCHRADRQICGGEGRAGGSEDSWRVGCLFCGLCRAADGGAFALYQFNNKCYVDTRGGVGGDKPVSWHLFCGRALYHGLQCDQQHFPRGRRLQKAHVLCGGGLRGQYRAGFCADRRPLYGGGGGRSGDGSRAGGERGLCLCDAKTA